MGEQSGSLDQTAHPPVSPDQNPAAALRQAGATAGSDGSGEFLGPSVPVSSRLVVGDLTPGTQEPSLPPRGKTGAGADALAADAPLPPPTRP